MRCFKIKCSNGIEIQIDEDEIEKVMENLGTKNFIKVRRGVFNPSFFVALIEDRERRNEYFADYKHQIKSGSMSKHPPQLKDMFEEVNKKLGITGK